LVTTGAVLVGAGATGAASLTGAGIGAALSGGVFEGTAALCGFVSTGAALAPGKGLVAAAEAPRRLVRRMMACSSQEPSGMPALAAAASAWLRVVGSTSLIRQTLMPCRSRARGVAVWEEFRFARSLPSNQRLSTAPRDRTRCESVD
jgi:hypothetical protein